MHKILVFDLDGTLAPVGKGMTDQDILILKELEQTGYRIAICSGKPSYYLCGFMRQIGLNAPILIGENGGTIQYGVELPPKKYYVYPCSPAAKAQLKDMRQRIDDTCGDQVWYQPNELGLTPFPHDETTFDDIQHIIDTNRDALSEVLVYRHIDSFDITPQNINKFNGLTYLAEIEGLTRKDFIAIGDGVNDVPMFDYSDISIGVGEKLKYPTTFSFMTVSEALNFMLKEKP